MLYWTLNELINDYYSYCYNSAKHSTLRTRFFCFSEIIKYFYFIFRLLRRNSMPSKRFSTSHCCWVLHRTFNGSYKAAHGKGFVQRLQSWPEVLIWTHQPEANLTRGETLIKCILSASTNRADHFCLDRILCHSFLISSPATGPLFPFPLSLHGRMA